MQKKKNYNIYSQRVHVKVEGSIYVNGAFAGRIVPLQVGNAFIKLHYLNLTMPQTAVMYAAFEY